MVVVKKDSTRKAADERTMSPPPDGGWGWVVVFASFMIHVIADGVTYTFGIFYYEFLKYYGSSKGTTAWVASIMVGTTYCIGPVASGLTNKYGCRAVTVAGAVLAGTGLAISTLAPDVLFLFFSTGLCTGAGLGLMYLPSIVSVTCYFEKQRAFATGVAVCGSGIGTFALAPLTEYLVEAYGWKGAMLLIAGLVLNCAVFGALFRPLEPPKLSACSAPLLVPEGDRSPFQADRKTILEETPFAEDLATPKLTNGFVSLSKPDLSTTTNGYSTHPSTPCESKANGFAKLRSNFEKKEDASCRNSLLLPSEFLRRKVEGGPLSSFVCSSASLAQTNKELSQLSSLSQSHAGGGLMCRKDIFYSGSLVSLAKYRSNPNLPYHSGGVDSPEKRREKEGCCPAQKSLCCPEEILSALREMTDFSLLRDPVFLLFAVSNFLTSIGFNVPYVYTKDRAAELGIGGEQASLLLSVIGVSNTVGRVTLGFLSDRACVNRLWIYNVSLILCGLATVLSCYADDYTLMAMYCATFGATAGAYVSLTSVILVDLLGLDKLTNAFGILLVFEGISCLLGPPITGWLYDGLGSYDPGFYMSGCMIAASGLILFLVPCLSRKLAPEEQLQPAIKLIAESAA
ncbi:monocarboxylate transporter 12-like [Uloborus diversus]|uniref:monocarboxylate transporter 12-like n=1 Tax=Uloborus diversus TaxID=327109 RepID=UPI002409856A|nr:monocarboxylate transporter 12-like [Uloborus diversus]